MVKSSRVCKPADVGYAFSNLPLNTEYLLGGTKPSDYAQFEGLQVNVVNGIQNLKLEHKSTGTYPRRIEQELIQTLVDGSGPWKMIQIKVDARGARLQFMRIDNERESWWMTASADYEVTIDIKNRLSDSVCQYCCRRPSSIFSCPLVIQQIGDEVSREVFVFKKHETKVYKVSP